MKQIRLTVIVVVLGMCLGTTHAFAEEGPCQEKDQKQKVACLNVWVDRLNKAPKPTAPTQWNVGCANGVCVSVDGKGALVFFDGSQKKITGKGQLPGTVTAPVSVSCNTLPGQEGCVAVDGVGRFWIGSPRADNYQLVDQMGARSISQQTKETEIPEIKK